MTEGQALVGSLRAATLKKDISLLLPTSLESLVAKDNRVVGVKLSHNGRQMQNRARHGVILAFGDFESNQAMCEQYLPKPTIAMWITTPSINYSDGIRAGISLGADLKFMNLTWGTPTVAVLSASSQLSLFIESSFLDCIIVNQHGERFVNEAASYSKIVYAIYADYIKTGATVPYWLLFGATFHTKYPMSRLLPHNIQRDSSLPKEWLHVIYYKANSLRELSTKIGVNFEGLSRSVAGIRQFANTDKDIQFGKVDKRV